MPAYYYGSAACPPPLGLVPNYSPAAFPEHGYPLDLAPLQPFFRNHAPSPPRHQGPRGLTFPNNRGGFMCEKLYAQAMHRNDKGRAAAAADCRRAVACGPRARTRGRSPSPVFTTRPETWIPPPPWFGRTTVMIRNLPTRLT
jgi:hypothetical protein